MTSPQSIRRARSALGIVTVALLAACGRGGGPGSAHDSSTDVDASDGGVTDADGLADAGDAAVNAQPTFPIDEPRIAARAGQQMAFDIGATDPEGDSFAVLFAGCAHDLGVIELCVDANCSQVLTLDCSVAHDPSTVPTPLAIDPSLIGNYEPGTPVDTGDRYNTAYFVLDDDASPLPPREVSVVFDVIRDNHAPVLLIQQEDHDSWSYSPMIGEDVPLDLVVNDEEVDQSDFYTMTVEGTLDNALTPGAVIDVSLLMAGVTACGETVSITETSFSFTCTVAPIGEFLRSLKILSPSAAEGAGGPIVLTVRVDDNGNAGQCPSDTAFNTTPCPLDDTLTMTLDYVEP